MVQKEDQQGRQAPEDHCSGVKYENVRWALKTSVAKREEGWSILSVQNQQSGFLRFASPKFITVE